jgi:uncharacterized protein YkwD
MLSKLLKIAGLLAAPFVLSACQSSSPTNIPMTPVLMIAAGGEIDPATGLRQFPETITGGDGFQVNSSSDASFATLINAVRADAGSPALSYNAQLDRAAQAHSNDMFANGVLTHTGSTAATATLGQRVTATGYQWTALGENIARGQANENAVINAWITSPGHQRNNVDPTFEDFGLARTGRGSNTFWTLVLGAQ